MIKKNSNTNTPRNRIRSKCETKKKSNNWYKLLLLKCMAF